MNYEEAVDAMEDNGELEIADIPGSTMLAVSGTADAEAERIMLEEYEGPILRIYEAQDDSEAVGEALAEADIPELPRVIDIVEDNDISLDAEDCRAARDAYLE